MNRAVLRALLGLRLAEARRSPRKVSTYLSWAFLLALTLAAQYVTGIGAANPDARPASQDGGLWILGLVFFGAVTAGLGGPVWAVLRREAQWVVTAPGGARALVIWRTGRSVLSRFVDILLLVLWLRSPAATAPTCGSPWC